MAISFFCPHVAPPLVIILISYRICDPTIWTPIKKRRKKKEKKSRRTWYMLDLAIVYLFLVNIDERSPSWWRNMIPEFVFKRVKPKGESCSRLLVRILSLSHFPDRTNVWSFNHHLSGLINVNLPTHFPLFQGIKKRNKKSRRINLFINWKTKDLFFKKIKLNFYLKTLNKHS